MYAACSDYVVFLVARLMIQPQVQEACTLSRPFPFSLLKIAGEIYVYCVYVRFSLMYLWSMMLLFLFLALDPCLRFGFADESLAPL